MHAALRLNVPSPITLSLAGAGCSVDHAWPIRSKAAMLLALVAKRSNPSFWEQLLPELLTLGSHGPVHARMVGTAVNKVQCVEPALLCMPCALIFQEDVAIDNMHALPGFHLACHGMHMHCTCTDMQNVSEGACMPGMPGAAWRCRGGYPIWR